MLGSSIGGLAGAYYGLEENLVEKVKPFLKDYMGPIIKQFYERNKVKCKRK